MTFSYFSSVQSLPLAAALACCFLHISSDIMGIDSTLGARNPLPSKRKLNTSLVRFFLNIFKPLSSLILNETAEAFVSLNDPPSNALEVNLIGWIDS